MFGRLVHCFNIVSFFSLGTEILKRQAGSSSEDSPSASHSANSHSDSNSDESDSDSTESPGQVDSNEDGKIHTNSIP